MSYGNYCMVKNCGNNKKNFPELTFFTLPKKMEIALKWAEFSGREDINFEKRYTMCCEHFTENQYRTVHPRKMLYAGSIPHMKGPRSINIEQGVPTIYDDVKMKKEPGIIDVIEQFIDQKDVYVREEYMIKSEVDENQSWSDPICSVPDGNSNQSSSTSCTDEKPQLLDPLAELAHFENQKSRMDENPDGKKKELDVSSLKDNSGGHEKSQKYKCNLCEYATRRRENLRSHVDSTHLNIKKYECHLCDYASNSKRTLETHIKTVHLNIEDYGCHLSEYSTDIKHLLDEHVNSFQSDTKEYKCHLCEYAADQEAKLEEHVNAVHLKIELLECHLCVFFTHYETVLQAHIESVHLNIEKHKCHLCDFAANNKNELEVHINCLHFNVNEYKCHLCEYGANKKDTLLRHIDLVHLNIKGRSSKSEKS
ncbi:zinc finger Y-chromosomal protein 1-like [Coccinella septempunctata]|uniref:zinc finger Y-chromosomal protein 1-like n=1 Tax=Coccinella septempunctata TaxID=41139 RepID=UPI001D05DA8A|nr:zinc finger Y-chromosomal protein 1-like [Coccinella septempunctata]